MHINLIIRKIRMKILKYFDVFNNEKDNQYRSIIKFCKNLVYCNFSEIYDCIEMGSYIEPENYFVTYIFKLDRDLNRAKQNGLLEKIKAFHKEQLVLNSYPQNGIKDCLFASLESCKRECNGNWYYYYH